MIIFERNNSNKVITESAIHYDCYRGSKLIGYFEVYSDFSYIHKENEKKKNEIYIEVLEKHQHKGYAKDIYISFLKKKVDLGFKTNVFYAYILNINAASLALHKSLNFKILKQLKRYTIFEVK